jgi:hypothetical protein
LSFTVAAVAIGAAIPCGRGRVPLGVDDLVRRPSLRRIEEEGSTSDEGKEERGVDGECRGGARVGDHARFVREIEEEAWQLTLQCCTEWECRGVLVLDLPPGVAFKASRSPSPRCARRATSQSRCALHKWRGSDNGDARVVAWVYNVDKGQCKKENNQIFSMRCCLIYGWVPQQVHLLSLVL